MTKDRLIIVNKISDVQNKINQYNKEGYELTHFSHSFINNNPTYYIIMSKKIK